MRSLVLLTAVLALVAAAAGVRLPARPGGFGGTFFTSRPGPARPPPPWVRTPPPTTAVPTTVPPTTETPTTAAPTTGTPTTETPTTAAPTTMPSTTETPTTTAPTTALPTTEAPTTPVPTTDAPTTVLPTTPAPTTPVPTTTAPTTPVSTTPAPTTPAPTTPAPTTPAPTTPAPTTLAPTTAVPTTAPPPTVFQAIFSWSDSDCVLGVPSPSAYYATCGAPNAAAYQQAMVGNMTAPFNALFPPFNRLYFSVPVASLTSAQTQIAAFVQLLHANGIGIEFLDGADTWVTSDDSVTGRGVPVAECGAVAAYNAAVAPDARFDGVMYDIEPSSLGAPWHTNQTAGGDNYNAFYEANLMWIFDQCRTALPSPTTLAWCAGDDFYYYVTGLWRPLTSSRPFVDYVLNMGYYNNYQQFVFTGDAGIGGATNVIASLAGSAVQAVLAAEFQYTRWVPAAITLSPNGTRAGMALLGNATGLFAGNPNFLGTAVHFYTPFFALGLDGPRTPPTAWPPTCTTAANAVTVKADVYYFKCYKTYVWSAGKWMFGKNKNFASTTSSASFGNPGPYQIVLYDTAGCTTTNYLPLTVSCT